MAERTNFEFYRGTTVTLRFQLVTPEPANAYVTGWTTQFLVKANEEDANAVVTSNGSISTLTNALEYGIFDVELSTTQTAALLHGRTYRWSFRRTNTGYEDVLGLGEVRAWSAS